MKISKSKLVWIIIYSLLLLCSIVLITLCCCNYYLGLNWAMFEIYGDTPFKTLIFRFTLGGLIALSGLSYNILLDDGDSI